VSGVMLVLVYKMPCGTVILLIWRPHSLLFANFHCHPRS
jgi:hypothetical protein